jgi:hypothetical protein
MTRDIQIAEGNVDETLGMIASNEMSDEDGDIDRIVMNLASEKIMDAVEERR